ncbi:MAG: TauD/TfdA family dioxygenase [Cyanobacteriota bacterium]|nr:TauD/TfdA family dioxygenase [Cyanobacteriota bacterium]
MTAPTPRFLGWEAAELAADPRWIFAADPQLAEANPQELRAWLAPLRAELGRGWGLAWVRGLGDLPEAWLRRLFLAIGRALGPVDTTYGELYPVTDTGVSHLERAIPVSQTRAATSMHTDSSQRLIHPRWVGLACLRQAPEGGGSRLASAVAVHDHLAERDPETLRRLHRWFHRDLVTPGGQRDRPQRLANRFPIYQQAADGPTLRYMRHWIETGHARLGKPLAPEDLGAFDRLDATLNDPRFRLALRLAPGDLLFCDNHKLAHDREAYRDDPAAPRLLLRLWLNASAPGLPPDGGPPRPS